MNANRDDPTRPARVREPVQVYLDQADLDRLDRLRRQMEASKSDVLRRGLEALERDLLDPDRHPALRIIGLLGAATPATPGEPDAAREHDRVLADEEEASWSGGRRGR